jgi:hypothetical protein
MGRTISPLILLIHYIFAEIRRKYLLAKKEWKLRSVTKDVRNGVFCVKTERSQWNYPYLQTLPWNYTWIKKAGTWNSERATSLHYADIFCFLYSERASLFAREGSSCSSLLLYAARKTFNLKSQRILVSFFRPACTSVPKLLPHN